MAATGKAGRERARAAVRDELRRLGVGQTAFARSVELDAATLGDFLGGARWPRAYNLGKIEVGLGWPPGTLDLVAGGQSLEEAVRRPREDPDEAAIRELADVTPAERAVLLRTLQGLREAREAEGGPRRQTGA